MTPASPVPGSAIMFDATASVAKMLLSRRVTRSLTVRAAAIVGAATTPAAVLAQTSIADGARALQLREVGPAAAGGRIADIEVHPHNSSIWYVAAGSGGV